MCERQRSRAWSVGVRGSAPTTKKGGSERDGADRRRACPETAKVAATSLGGWEGGLPGSAQGLACHTMRGSHIALMATARQSDRGLQVEQLVAVVDAGRLVNPAIARQQIEGGLIFGLAAAVGATTADDDSAIPR